MAKDDTRRSNREQLTRIAAAATVGIGIFVAGMATYQYFHDDVLNVGEADIMVGAQVVTDHLAKGQRAFMRGMADAYDDSHMVQRGTWTDIDYGANIYEFEMPYRHGYSWQNEHDLGQEDLRQTFVMSAGWTRMARMTSDILAREYADIPGAGTAVAATMLGGVIDATSAEVEPSEDFLAAIADLSRTGDEDVDGTLRRLRLTVSGVHSQFFGGDHEMLAKLSGDALLDDDGSRPTDFAKAMRAEIMAKVSPEFDVDVQDPVPGL